MISQFKDHYDYMLKKIGKKTSFLNRIGSFVSPYNRCIVYKSIIAPHFEYYATLLIEMGETQSNKLQIAQNRAMRIILRCNRFTKVEHMLQALQFMSVKQRVCYNMAVFTFKILNNMASVALSNKIEIVGRDCDRRDRPRRRRSDARMSASTSPSSNSARRAGGGDMTAAGLPQVGSREQRSKRGVRAAAPTRC